MSAEKSIAAIDVAEGTDKQIILVGQKQPEQENVAADDLYEWGVLANIKQRLQLPNGAVRLLVEGLERVHVLNAVEVHENEQDFFVGEVEVVPADDAVDAEAEACAVCCWMPLSNGYCLRKRLIPIRCSRLNLVLI